LDPETRYARSGDLSIAYQVLGDGPLDLVLVPGWVSHLDYAQEYPRVAEFARRLASFSRLICFDKRGTGLSDRIPGVATLEERMDDVRAVLDTIGSRRAALLGVSEGGPMSVLFAATYPERTSALVLYGTMAKFTASADYPLGFPSEFLGQLVEAMIARWGRPDSPVITFLAPSLAGDERFREFWARFERAAASPGAFAALMRMNAEIDVRHVLPTIRVPTLVLHREGDSAVNVDQGRYIAERIPGAKYVELPGVDHLPMAGDFDAMVDEVEEFLTGVRHAPESDRVLATVLFTDIVGATERAAELGDHAWRALLEEHHAAVRREIARFRGREVKTIGDGFLVTFDGPARAIRCARAAREAVARLGLEMRAGLHTGECERMGDDVGGIAVHIGARVAASAQPGEVLVSSTVKDLVAGSGLRFGERGIRALKGVPGDWRLYAVEA
jgi:class 3 adenylate cyclase/pimeloyl-ACP methyl ester carboxylesterase